MLDPFYFESKPQTKQDIFFDSHCHLQYEPLSLELADVVQQAQQVGLKKLICIGTDYESSQKAIQIAKQYPGYVYATVGEHPCEHNQTVSKFETDKFRKLIQAESQYVVAVGETGLDLHHDQKFSNEQLASLQAHIELALEFNLPVVLHIRPYDTCFEQVWDMLEQNKVQKAIFHCYSGSLQQAQRIWAKGYKTSFSLIVSYPKNTQLHEVYKLCPLENLLIETDAPFLPPQSKRGKTCYPHYLEFFQALM